MIKRKRLSEIEMSLLGTTQNISELDHLLSGLKEMKSAAILHGTNEHLFIIDLFNNGAKDSGSGGNDRIWTRDAVQASRSSQGLVSTREQRDAWTSLPGRNQSIITLWNEYGQPGITEIERQISLLTERASVLSAEVARLTSESESVAKSLHTWHMEIAGIEGEQSNLLESLTPTLETIISTLDLYAQHSERAKSIYLRTNPVPVGAYNKGSHVTLADEYGLDQIPTPKDPSNTPQFLQSIFEIIAKLSEVFPNENSDTPEKVTLTQLRMHVGKYIDNKSESQRQLERQRHYEKRVAEKQAAIEKKRSEPQLVALPE